MGAGVRVRESIVLHGASLHVSKAYPREGVSSPGTLPLLSSITAPSRTPGPHLRPQHHRGLGQHHRALGPG